MKTTNLLLIAATAGALTMGAHAQVGVGTATIEQTIDYTYLDEELDYEFAAGLWTGLPDDESYGEIGPFGLGQDCFSEPDQPYCLGTRIAPFDETLGTLVAVTLDFSILDSIAYGEFDLDGILNTGVPHMASTSVTTQDIEWLIDVGIDADAFFVAGNPSFTFGVSCLGNPGDEDDCAGGFFDVLNFGFGFNINQTWDDNDPEWFGPNGIEHLFLSSNVTDVYLTVITNSMIAPLMLDNIASGEVSLEGISVLGEDIQLIVTYEYIPSSTPDSDGDGVLDDADNCTLAANSNQIDVDADGYGNACDADLNNDGVINAVDLGIFRLGFFSMGITNTDFNADGVTNAIDLGILRLTFFGAPGPSALAP